MAVVFLLRMATHSLVQLDDSDLGRIHALIAPIFPELECAVREKILGRGLDGLAQAWGARAGDGRLIGVAAYCGQWLRLLVVQPNSRRTGIGHALLKHCESALRACGKTRMRLFDEPGNYASPGIELNHEAAIAWFGRRGFVKRGENNNLLIDVVGNQAIDADRFAERVQSCADRGYQIVRVAASSPSVLKEKTIELAVSFLLAWGFEVSKALVAEPGAVFVAREHSSGKLVAFAAHDGNNRGMGWFGPAGTVEQHRGQGLGAALLIGCLIDIGDHGHRQANIAWIGPREFYRRVVGIVGERRFVTMEKTLS